MKPKNKAVTAYATVERRAGKVAKNKAVARAAKKAEKYRYNYYDGGEDEYVF